MKKRNAMKGTMGLFMTLCIIVAIAVGYAEAATKQAPKQPPAKTEQRSGGTLKIGTLRDARTFDVTKITSVYEHKIMNTAVEPLFRCDEKYRPVPLLVTAFKLSPDMLNLTLTLRKGVKFHDGSDFNASVVKFNLDRFKKSGSVFLSSLKQVDIVDNYTVRLVLSQPDNALANGDVGSYVLAQTPGLMISQKAFEANGEEWANTHPVGTGPFKLTTWQRDVSVKFERFDGYWQKGKPDLDKVEWTIISDPVTAVVSFKKGEIDVLCEPPQSDLKDFQDSSKYTILKFAAGVTGLAPDSSHMDSPFRDARVRQAVSYAIDNKKLSESLGWGLWVPTNQLDPDPAGLAHNPKVSGYPYNPQKAKALLAQAGYPNGFKTRLIGDAGRDDQWLTAVQQYLKQVGIDAEIELVTQALRNKYSFEGWKNGLVRFAIGKKIADMAPEMKIMLYSGSKQYVSMARSSAIDDLLDQALRAKNIKAKQEATRKLASLVVDKDDQVIILYGMSFPAVKYNKVRSGSIWELGPNWWMPEDAKIVK